LTKSNTLYYKKTLNKLGIEESFLNQVKDICERLTANFILRDTERFSSKIRSKPKMSALATLIQHCAGGYSKRIRQEKIKGIQIGRNT